MTEYDIEMQRAEFAEIHEEEYMLRIMYMEDMARQQQEMDEESILLDNQANDYMIQYPDDLPF